MYAISGNIYHQYTPNVSIYTIHGSYRYIYIYIILSPMIIGEIQAPWLSSPSASPWRMPMRCGTPIGRGMPGREARDFSIEDEDFT